MVIRSLVFVVLLCLSLQHIPQLSKKQIEDRINATPLMYGASIRIKAQAVPYQYNENLHSHQVAYPRGSGQQSVTGFNADNDYNSLWTIKEEHGSVAKTYSESIFCGDVVRLEHALTKKHLHSQDLYQSMITGGQQVSAVAQPTPNDNWIISCLQKKERELFLAGDAFELIHENSQKKLRLTKFYQYSYSNWENCPFQGQVEISAVEQSSRETAFKIIGGVFFKEPAIVQAEEL